MESSIGSVLRNVTEEGDEIGFVVEGEYHCGDVVEVNRIEGTPEEATVILPAVEQGKADLTKVALDNGWVLQVLAGDWTDGYDEDWNVSAASPTGPVIPVDQLYDWTVDPEAPDEYIGDLPEEQQIEIRENIDDRLDTIDDMLDEIELIKSLIEMVILGEITLAEFERRLLRYAAENGGELALDGF